MPKLKTVITSDYLGHKLAVKNTHLYVFNPDCIYDHLMKY